MTNFVQHESGPSAAPSSGVFGRQSLQGQSGLDGQLAVNEFYDFVGIGSTGEYPGGWVLLEADGSASITALDGVSGGVIRLATGAADNAEVNLEIPGGQPVGTVADGSGVVGVEARVKVSAVADGGIFFGLFAPGIAAANAQVDNTMVLKDTNYIALNTIAASPTEIDFSVRSSGNAAEEIAGNVATLAADTWTKLGIYFDGADQLAAYVDGVRVATASVSADFTNFPSDYFTVGIGTKAGDATGQNLDVDWIKVMVSH